MARNDSAAHRIAARHKPRTSGGGVLSNLRVPRSAVIQTVPIAAASNGKRSVRGDALTAAATVIHAQKLERTVKAPPAEEWQSEFWELRGVVGEMRFVTDRQARACSMVDLYVGRAEDSSNEPIPVTEGVGKELQQMLFGNKAGTEQFIKRGAQHIIGNGESIIHVKQDGSRLPLYARSRQELSGQPGNYKLNDGTASGQEDVPDDEILIRAWTPDPQFYGRADAPVKAMLPVARELDGLGKYVSAQIDSRLAGAGLLLLPEGIESMHSKGNPDYSFADELTDYFMTPIEDRDSAAAVVPFMAELTTDQIEAVKHITFASPLDAQAPQLREEAIRRLGLGLDSDPAILLGMGSSNHWSGWLVSEEEVRFVVSPVVAVLCHALTAGLLRPLLEQRGVPDAEQWSVWFDPTPLTVRPDRSKDAQALYDKGVLSAEVMRREAGFNEADAPDVAEKRDQLIEKAMGIRADLLDVFLPELGVDIEGLRITDADDTVEAPEEGEELALPGEGVAEPAPDGPPELGGPLA